MKKRTISLIVAIFVFSTLISKAHAGKIVLANDEWTLGDLYAGAFTDPNDAGVFATNVASWFTGGSSGNFLAYSSDFGLTGTNLANTMTSAGHGWNVSMAGSFDLATLSSYDAVFLAGNAADNSVLIDYVNSGGNVYLAGGTGEGGAVAEANRWNVFLNNCVLPVGLRE